MNKIIVLISCLFVVGLSATENNNQKKSIITKKTAKFIIPIEHQELISWNKKSTGDNQREYDCQIRINKYEFGFSKFKKPGAKENTGSINQFLDDGQFSLWEITNNGASVIDKTYINVRYQKPNLIIEVTDPKTYELIFSNKPRTYNLSISGFTTKVKSKSALIDYRQK